MSAWLKWQLRDAWEKGDKARIKHLNEQFFYYRTWNGGE